MRRLLGLVCLLLLAPAAGVCADDELETDRPDLAEGAHPVAPGHVQLELGWTRAVFSRRRHQDVVGEALLRVGVAPHVELRGLLPSWNRLSQQFPASAQHVEGFDAGGVGIKLGIPVASEKLAMGVLSHVIFPGGAGPFHSDRTNFDAVLAASWSHGEGALSGNVGVEHNEGYWGQFAVLSLSADLGARVGGYLESAMLSVEGERQWTWDTGVTWRLAPWTQLDARVGMISGSDVWPAFFGTGISQRW